MARAADPLGFDRTLWERLTETGAPGMGVEGATLGDLVVAAEQLDRAIAPVPLVEHLVASRAHPVTELCDGSTIATISLRPAVDGTWRLVPAGVVADVVIGHHGLTMFILPMDTPGISVEPVPTMGTERTNATFYDDVRVGEEAVLGDVHGGWSVMTVALSLERGVMGSTNSGVPLPRHFRHWAEASGAIADPVVRERMARVSIDNEVAKLLTQRSAWIAASGGTPGWRAR